LNAFNEISQNEYELSLTPEAVAELQSSDGAGSRDTADSSKGSGDFKDYKDGKTPVGEFLGQRSPYLPGGLGFPPNLTRPEARSGTG
jgi:hypothetical protein